MKLLAIVGPTASGKSALAIDMANKLNGEIICADSRTIYKYMDIGTAKPSKEDRSEVIHYGLDLIEPSEKYSANQFQAMAKSTIKEIYDKDKLPLVVGGSGMYIDGVLYDYEFGSIDSDLNIEEMDLATLQDLATKSGYQPSEQVLKNKRHLIGFIKRGGKSGQRSELPNDYLVVGLDPGRELISQRIEYRVKQMIEAGFVDEVKQLLERYSSDSPGFNAPGYLPIINYLKGDIGLDEAIRQFIANDKKLAKKQMTWFKRSPDIKWFDSAEKAESFILKQWS